MDIIQAIEKRISCRAFTTRRPDGETIRKLGREIEAINAEAGLHFQLYGPREDGTAITMAPNMFASNPPYYAALATRKGPIEEEKLGFYGERFVLLAEMLGLSTCWVASTYDQESTRVDLAEGEVLHDVIPLGYAPEKMPLKQRTIRSAIRGRSKKQDELYQGPVPLSQAPEWLRACVDAVWKGPSAINEQPVVFVQDEPNGPVCAKLARVKTGMEYCDLGIAKYHFQVIAEACGVPGTWQWGDGAMFQQ